MKLLRRTWPTVLALFVWGCGGAKKPEVDPISEAMKRGVAGSPARVEVVGRTDWEVVPQREQYWVNVRLINRGGAGTVAVRAAIKAMVPYVGIGASPTEPVYIHMNAGETVQRQLTGKLAAKMADKAIGCVVEVYPKAEPAQ